MEVGDGRTSTSCSDEMALDVIQVGEASVSRTLFLSGAPGATEGWLAYVAGGMTAPPTAPFTM